MLRTALAAALLLCSAPLAAQGDGAATTQDPQAAYKKLAKSFAEAMSAHDDELQAKIVKAKKAGERVPRSAFRKPTKEFVATAQELAREFEGKDDAVMFLGFIVKNATGERNAIKWAVKTLASDHAESKAIGDVVDYLPGVMRKARSARSLLNDVADNHADTGVRVQALLARARMNGEGGQNARAIADLEKVQGLTKDQDVLAEVADAMEEIKKFAIGSVAPDIDGVDVDGVSFKLSDYRGKVVLLDFWGFW